MIRPQIDVGQLASHPTRRHRPAAGAERHGADRIVWGRAVRCRCADRVLLVISGVVESSGTGQVHTRELIAAAHGESVFPHTVRARTDVTFASVPMTELDASGAAAQLDDVAPRILEILYRRDLVAKASAVFGPLNDAALAQIERESGWIDLKRGGVLMRQANSMPKRSTVASAG